MAAVIIPRDQLRIPDHLRDRLERPGLRLVAPEAVGPRPTTRVPTTRVRPVPRGAPRTAARPAVSVSPARVRRGGVAGLVVAACVAVVALTGVTALVAGRPAPAAAADPTPVATAAALPAGGVWVVQPGDSLWSIAAAVAPGADLRPVVDELARRAGGGSLQPGQRIALEGLVP